jgi:hypothetical protein
MSRSSRSLEDTLKKVRDIVSTVPTGQPASSPRESGEVPQSATPLLANDMQEAIIKEILYSQMIPTLTPSMVMSVYEGIERFTEDLKSLNQDPELKAKFDKLISPLIGGGDLRSIEPDPELVGVMTAMAHRLTGDTGERLFPIILGCMVAMGAGVAVGRALGDL